MSDSIIPSKGSSFLRKKVAGVPVLYLFGAGAVVLAFYAWKAKGKSATVTTAGDTTAAPTTTSPATTGTTAGSVYSSLTSGDGTVYASAGQVPDTAPATAAITTNDQWLSKAVAYIVGNDSSASPGAVQTALSTYLSGGQLSIQQGKWRDTAITQFGLPPNGNASAAKPHIQAFFRKIGEPTGRVYAALDDGSIVYVDAATYAALGKPPFSDIPATDPVWQRPEVSMVLTKDML